MMASGVSLSSPGGNPVTRWTRPQPQVQNPTSSGIFLERTSSTTASLYRTETWDRPPATVEAVPWSVANLLGRTTRRGSLANPTASLVQTGVIGRTETWDRPPLSSLSRSCTNGTEYFSVGSSLSPGSRTETWDRPPLATGSPEYSSTPLDKTSSIGFSVGSTLSPTSRTETWDMPPLAAGPSKYSSVQLEKTTSIGTGWTQACDRPLLARTNTVLESARVSASMPSNSLLTSSRPATYPPGSSKPPLLAAVPPTTLRRVQPLPVQTSTRVNESKFVEKPFENIIEAQKQAQSKVPSGPALGRNQIGIGVSNSLATSSLRSHARSPIPPRSKSITFRRANTSDLSSPFRPLQFSPLQRTCTESSYHTAASTISEDVVYPLLRTSTAQPSSSSSPRRPILERAATVGGAVLGSALANRTLSVGSTAPLVPISKTRSSSVTGAKLDSEKCGPRPAQYLDERGSSVPPVKKELQASVLQPVGEVNQKQFYPQVSPKSDGPVVVPETLRQVKSKTRSRQLRLIVAGLMGSGKSTLCRMLANLLGGTWVNQDEFSHKGKGAKKAFLAEIGRAAGDKSVPVLLVDKINTQKQHRREILDAMESGVAGDIVLLQLRHPQDQPESFEQQVKLCLSRIESRGEGHRTLMGSDPKLQSILRMTVSGIEPMVPEEVQRFKLVCVVDMTQTPIEMVQKTLMDLSAVDLLDGFSINELLVEQRLQEAFDFTRTTEEDLAGAHKPQAKGQAKSVAKGQAKPSSSQSPGGRKKKPPPLWIYVLEFDEASKESIRNVWNICGNRAPSLTLGQEFHVTLLYLGGGSDSEIASRHPSLGGVDDVRRLRESLSSQEGVHVEIELKEIVWDDRLAAAPASGLSSNLCANTFPHITLALAPGVAPRVSNELLARRAANDDIRVGLGPWLEQLGLQQYKTEALQWCVDNGAASTEEIAENAGDLAAYLESSNVEERDRVEAIFARAAPGKVCVTPLTPSLKLRGRVHGRLRGQ